MPGDTKGALLAAAFARFARDGYPATSIRALAADVGIKESSVYKHFASKEAILDAVLEVADARLDALAARFGLPADDAAAATPFFEAVTPDLLREIAEGYLHLWLHDADVVAVRRLLTLEQYRTPAAGRMLRDLVVERALAFQTPLFAEVIGRGLFRPADPAAVALAFWGPIVAILAVADSPDDEPLARTRLGAHLDHFRATHAIAQDLTDGVDES